MTADRKARLQNFVDWAAAHITGDEKGEAQIFLDRLLQAFYQKGLLEIGKAEFRIRKAKEDGGGTAFADFVWKPLVLIEMKRRGADLRRYYRQAFDYWTRLVPGRPNYVVLCNFDEFWIYDFDVQLDEPLDRLKTEELPERYGPLAFLFPTAEKPKFNVNKVQVTRDSADRLAELFNKLITRGIDRETAQRFVLQCLIALFAEDIGLLNEGAFINLLDECDSPQKAYDLIGGLFNEMNTPGKTPGGRYKGTDYFNGGIFAVPARVELYPDEISQLTAAATEKWVNVQPEIFGTIFEHSIGDVRSPARRTLGIQYTSAADIMKVIKPTITEPWEMLIRRAKTIIELRQLHERMQHFRVLDPACGSGNFLYLAYRELKRLEKKLFDRMDEISSAKGTKARRLSFVTARQFYGIDIIPFAVELAKVTMMIARKLAIEELHIDEPALPFDDLDANFVSGDALIQSESMHLTGKKVSWRRPLQFNNEPIIVSWPPADVIIGNPPFNGAKKLKPDLGPEYVDAVRKAYPDVPGMADYCVYWFRRAHDHLPLSTPDDPVAGRAGLVGTQNIRSNKSREGGLDYIVRSGTIVEAVDSQPWSGEANVSVSIANWVKHSTIASHLTEREKSVVRTKLLIPERRKLWFKAVALNGTARRKRGEGSAGKIYELVFRECDTINSALSDQAKVDSAVVLPCNTSPQVSFQGVKLGYKGYAIPHSQRREFIRARSRNREVARPWLIGRNLLTGDGTPTRSVIDFGTRDMIQAQSYDEPFELLREKVLPAVRKTARETEGGPMESARADHLERWWQFWNVRQEMRRTFSTINRYIACSQVTKRPIFCFVSVDITPDATLQVWSLADDYSFGVIQSQAHWSWFFAKCSKLTERYRYTRRSVWDTFPWPQLHAVKDVSAVAKAAGEVRRIRETALTTVRGGLRGLYRTFDLPGKSALKDAHAALDAAVLAAYGFSPKKDLLQQLLDLNHEVAARIDRSEPVTAPGIPPDFPNPRSLITDDCIGPAV